MCEANLYIIENGNEALLMESVDLVEPEGGGWWRMVNIFGDQKRLKGKIIVMNLVAHKILFEVVSD